MRKELPKVYEPGDVESRIYQMWMDNDCFKAEPAALTARSAQGSGTTWAALHGSLHRPLPLFASADRLLLPIIADFLMGNSII